MQRTFARTVYCEDALSWLEKSQVLDGCSTVASLPDISEFTSYSLEQWSQWFINAAALIISKTPAELVSIFYQSDIKFEGAWVDKSYLCQKAAEQEGARLLWHKIACRAQPGQATYGRTGYSHVLCFSKKLRLDHKLSTADVLPDLGEKTWERGMGLNACIQIAKFIREQTTSTTLVNPFCGQGSMLAVANAYGLTAIGLERSASRAEIAKNLEVDLEQQRWLNM